MPVCYHCKIEKSPHLFPPSVLRLKPYAWWCSRCMSEIRGRDFGVRNAAGARKGGAKLKSFESTVDRIRADRRAEQRAETQRLIEARKVRLKITPCDNLSQENPDNDCQTSVRPRDCGGAGVRPCDPRETRLGAGTAPASLHADANLQIDGKAV